MKKYEKLLGYISIFEDEANGFCTWVTPELNENEVIRGGIPSMIIDLNNLLRMYMNRI